MFFSLTKAPVGPPKMCFTCSISREAIEKSVKGIEHPSLAVRVSVLTTTPH